jgi:hypothetical protein
VRSDRKARITRNFTKKSGETIVEKGIKIKRWEYVSGAKREEA